ncbi:TetR/AcrR family transcriptional regulator (plasmid) [Streptomyces sp. C1-1]|uniref:TetR/AcrR family transcriptional regulator n=1 Tax=Streptomyces sp. C1-1 TaxID=3231173 RepID=UPI003CFCE8B7
MRAGRSGHFGWVVGVARTGRADVLYAHGADAVIKDLRDLTGTPDPRPGRDQPPLPCGVERVQRPTRAAESRAGNQKGTLRSFLERATVRSGNLANVAEQARDKNSSRLTERGRATRERILRAASDMMYVKGVSLTTLDDVRAASGTSKSQLYRHYPDKDALVRDVVALQAAEVLDRHQQLLRRLNSFRGLERWRDAVVERNALRNGAYGCPLGSLASELADQDEEARKVIARHFATWEGLLEAGLVRMKDSGVLRADADAKELATGLMAALQGGYLLAQTAQDVKPMKIALDMAIAHVRTYVLPAEDDDADVSEGEAVGR